MRYARARQWTENPDLRLMYGSSSCLLRGSSSGVLGVTRAVTRCREDSDFLDETDVDEGHRWRGTRPAAVRSQARFVAIGVKSIFPYHDRHADDPLRIRRLRRDHASWARMSEGLSARVRKMGRDTEGYL